jgi:hypothetical protein
MSLIHHGIIIALKTNGAIYMTINVKDEVVMKASVIKRTNHSEFAKNFKGIVASIVGNTADVTTSTGLRSVPLANLAVVRQVTDARTGQSSRLILD